MCFLTGSTLCSTSIRLRTGSTTLGAASTPSGGTFDYAERKDRLTEVLRELEDPQVWSDPERAQSLGKERAALETVVVTVDELSVPIDV